MGCGGSKKDVPEQAHSENPNKKDSHPESQPSSAQPAEKKHEETAKPQVKEENAHAVHKEEKKPAPTEKKEDHKVDKPEDHQVEKKEEHKPDKHEEQKVDKHNGHEELKEEHKVDKHEDHHVDKHEDHHVDKHEDHHVDKHEEPKVAKDHEHKADGKKPDQAGGHSGSLIARGDKLLKKAGPKEQAFYKYLFSDECTDSALLDLRSIVPHYFGTEEIEGKTYMVLENLLTGYENANLLDCKIGKVTWTRDHNERKATDQQNKASNTTTGSLGFRITGLVVKDNSGETTESIVKDEGFFSINSENIHEYFQKIVGGDKHQVQVFIDQTEKIIHWFKSQTSKVFFTASLFYVNGKNGKSQTRFIDLAYVYDAEGQHDQSNSYLDVIQGLESVVEIWKRLL